MKVSELTALHESIKPRRVALGLTQPQAAAFLGYNSKETYIRYELYGSGFTVDELLRIDGSFRALEALKGLGVVFPVHNPVDKSGDKNGEK